MYKLIPFFSTYIDPVARAKQIAAEEMATASEMHYLMYAGSRLMKENVLETSSSFTQGTLS